MKLKVITLRFKEAGGGFDDGPLQAFAADKEVISFSEHFFVHESTPYLTLVMAYRPVAEAGQRPGGRRPDFRPELSADEKPAYEALKTWRAVRARAEGIPPYLIASNRQLSQMIALKPASRAALTRIAGIGEAKAAKYGDEILAILKTHLKTPPDEAPVAGRQPES